MNFIVYFFVALIAAFSVLFGLDWSPAPMSPMPPSKYEIRAAVPPPPVVAETKPDATPDANAKPEATLDGKPAAKPAPVLKPVTPSVAAQTPVPSDAADRQPPSIVAAEPGSIAAPPAPKCNVEVCASAYRSFTAADCTYQPSDGPRRLCTKGMPPPAAAAPATPPTTASGAAAPEARAQACNVAACSQSYPRSFNAADCTFQPSEGPRRVCTK